MKDILIAGEGAIFDMRGKNAKSVFFVDKANCIDNQGQRTRKATLDFVGGFESGRRLHDGKNLSRNFRQGFRIYSENGKAATLTAQSKGGPGSGTGLYLTKDHVKKLSPIECERLQTLPDNYTEGISDTQRYRCVGNGWNVDTIVHLLKYYRP